MSSDHSKPRSPLAVIQDYSLPLIFGVIAAVVWANVDMHSYEQLLSWTPHHGDGHDGGHGHGWFKFIVDDLFMALFFGIAAKEITEACLPGGDLSSPAKAANPLLGTLGGVLGPVAVYLAYCKFVVADPDLGSKIAIGWGVPTATDIALAWLVARLAFGNKHPAVKFLLLLAVADDAIGLGIIAIFYSGGESEPQWHMLMLVVLGMAIAFGLRKMKVTNFWVYLLIPGALSWAGLFTAHLHPALALVPIVPFMPSKGYDVGLYKEQETPEKFHNTLDNFEHFFKTPVDYGLFCFGLANAGVAFSVVGDATWAVLAALVIGKTVGIFLFSAIGNLVGLSLPDGMDLRTLLVAGLTAGLGLTVALFVAGVAYPGEAAITGAAKMGALLSAFVAPVVLVLARVLQIQKMN